jgi:hypothetical protein
MAGINQHFIPQFLQKGFSISDESGKGFSPKGLKGKSKALKQSAQVWVFEKNKKPYPTNTRNKGAQRFFYGLEDSELDKKITKAENGYAGLVDKLRNYSSDASVIDPHVPKLAAHLFLRSKHVRATLAELGDSAVGIVAQSLPIPSNMAEYLADYLRNNPDSLDNALQKYPPEQRELVKNSILQDPDFLSNLFEISEPQLQELALQFKDNLFSLKAEVHGITKDAHNDALFEATAESVRLFHDLSWFILVKSVGSYILGDVISIYQMDNGGYRSILLGGQDFQCVLLPLSSQHLLVGSKGSEIPSFSIDDVNQAIVSNSNEFFIASQNTEREKMYLNQLAKGHSEMVEQLTSEMRIISEKRVH